MKANYKYSKNLEITYDAKPNNGQIPCGFITVENPNKTIQRYRDNNLPEMNCPETALISNKKFKIVGFVGEYLKNRSSIFYEIIVYVFTLNKNISVYIPIEQISNLIMESTFINGESSDTYSLLFSNNDLIFVRESLDNVLYVNNVPFDEEGNITQSKTKKRIPKNKLQVGHIYEDDKGNKSIFLGEYVEQSYKTSNKNVYTPFFARAYITTYVDIKNESKYLYWVKLEEEDLGKKLMYNEFKAKYLNLDLYKENSLLDLSYSIKNKHKKCGNIQALSKCTDMFNKVLFKFNNEIPNSMYFVKMQIEKYKNPFKPMVYLGEFIEDSTNIEIEKITKDIFKPNIAFKNLAKELILPFVYDSLDKIYIEQINQAYQEKHNTNYYTEENINIELIKFLGNLSDLDNLEEALEIIENNYPQLYNDINRILFRFNYYVGKENHPEHTIQELKLEITKEFLNYCDILLEFQ